MRNGSRNQSHNWFARSDLFLVEQKGVRSIVMKSVRRKAWQEFGVQSERQDIIPIALLNHFKHLKSYINEQKTTTKVGP